MSIELLELAAENLGDLLPEVVFVGGATVGQWISDPAAPPFRPTKDVDVIVEVVTRSEDFMASRDFSDVVVLIDGREELLDEIRATDDGLRRYLAEALTELAQDVGFEYGILGALLPDEASQDRADSVIRPRMREIVSQA